MTLRARRFSHEWACRADGIQRSEHYGSARGLDRWGTSADEPVPRVRDSARMAEARHAEVRAQAEREGLERAIEVEVRAAMARLDAARERERVGQAALMQARESQRIVRDRYDGGLATISDVLRAAGAVLDAESRATAAQADVILEAVALDRAVGRL